MDEVDEAKDEKVEALDTPPTASFAETPPEVKIVSEGPREKLFDDIKKNMPPEIGKFVELMLAELAGAQQREDAFRQHVEARLANLTDLVIDLRRGTFAVHENVKQVGAYLARIAATGEQVVKAASKVGP